MDAIMTTKGNKSKNASQSAVWAILKLAAKDCCSLKAEARSIRR
jgi:hypothetical protein